MGKLRKMRTTEDDEDDTETSTSSETARPAWMTNLRSNAEAWLKVLPESLDIPTSADSPLSRFFARECSIGSRLLSRITKDLSELVEVCNGSVKQTNELRVLMSDLNRGEFCASHYFRCLSLTLLGEVPTHWLKFKTSKGVAVASFITDLASRLAQLQTVARSADYSDGIWLGGLFQPEAFITATRQAVAHKNGWSLEQLVLQLGVEQPDTPESFGVRGQSSAVASVGF